MSNKKILVVGYGYVGKAMVDMLREHYDVLVYDPTYSGANNFENVSFMSEIADAKDCVLGVICVPTPQKDDNSCDTSLVKKAVKEINAPVILLKSTVSPGTTERLKKETGKRIVFSPEYVGESKYYNPYFNNDMKAVPFLILGGAEEDGNYILDLFLPILGPTKQYFKTAALNAEVTKYMENTFFATKITFVNEMYEICKAFGADWYDVREGWLLDPRVERMHTAVFPEKRGFSGKCLPKDTSALVEASKKAGYLPKFLEQMIESNKEFKEKNKKGE
jgi:nucleotide sugar dehydrogenase